MYTINIFLKFGDEEHMKDLFHNGTIYMNPIQRFREIEDSGLRGDKYEGIIRIKNYPSGEFKIPALGFKGNYIALQVREAYEKVSGNIYSLYCISSHGWDNPMDFKIDNRIIEFGSHCVMIKDIPKFMSLIENELRKLKIKFIHDFVEYYDKDKVNREINLFEKPNSFEYQKEFRYYVDRPSTQPYVFKIGSLIDIAELHSTQLIIDELKIQLE